MAKVKLAQPRVSIIILNWNGLEDTTECLESLKKITYPNYEVIVVDNGSQGNDAQVLKDRFSDYIHLIENDKNYGFASGVNIGIRYAMDDSPPDYFLLLNNDTTVAPDFLGQLVKVAERDISIGIVGPKVYYYDSPNLIQCIGAKMNMWTGKGSFIGVKQVDTGQYDHQKEVDLVVPCTLLRAEVVHRVGFYDEKYFCYLEDSDYCARARRSGYRIMYSPEARIWHKLGQSAQKVTGLIEYYFARNRIRFMKKNATRSQYVSFLMYLLAYHFWFVIAQLIYHRKMKQLAAFYRGVRDGLFDSDAGGRFYR